MIEDSHIFTYTLVKKKHLPEHKTTPFQKFMSSRKYLH
jgi:hypothetical protein